MNGFSARTAQSLSDLLANLLELSPVAPNEWGFTTGMLENATGASQLLQTAIAQRQQAVAAEKAATQLKIQARESAIFALNALAKEAYGNYTVSDASLAKIGFAPRPVSTNRPKAAVPVTDLKATPATDGSVRLSWNRSGNSTRATFQVESSADGATWTIAAATPRVSLTLDGYAPGATVWFRVTATNAGDAARPSTAIAIYGPAAPAPVQLRLAA